MNFLLIFLVLSDRKPEDVRDLLEINMRHIRNNPLICKVLNSPPDRYIAMLQYDGMFLQYIIVQSEQLCLEAIKENKNALQYVSSEFKAACEKVINDQYPVIFDQTEIILKV